MVILGLNFIGQAVSVKSQDARKTIANAINSGYHVVNIVDAKNAVITHTLTKRNPLNHKNLKIKSIQQLIWTKKPNFLKRGKSRKK